MKRALSILGIVGVAAIAMAFSSIEKVFDDTYKVAKGSDLEKAACGTCHGSAKGGKLNPYGKDLQTAMKAANSKKMTPAILKSVEGLDSDKDGVKNGDEIKKDSNPGAK